METKEDKEESSPQRYTRLVSQLISPQHHLLETEGSRLLKDEWDKSL